MKLKGGAKTTEETLNKLQSDIMPIVGETAVQETIKNKMPKKFEDVLPHQYIRNDEYKELDPEVIDLFDKDRGIIEDGEVDMGQGVIDIAPARRHQEQLAEERRRSLTREWPDGYASDGDMYD